MRGMVLASDTGQDPTAPRPETEGTRMIEVYPERATLDIPDRDDQVVFGENRAPPQNWPFHMLPSVPLQPERVERIGAREGWRARPLAGA
jgi:hypothetical protein